MIRVGAYVVEKEIGRGAMGTVFLVRHEKLGVRRALKLLSDASNPTRVERFMRELEVLGRVGGEGVVPIHEAGIVEGRPFYVMELMSGGSLRDRLHGAGRIPWVEASRIVIELGRALQRCHDEGLIHRDLKPDNILFDEHGRPRLADFGTARDLMSTDRLTKTGMLIGTPCYMAPEQLRGEKADARADVYALGVVLHELITGELPYEPASLVVLLENIEKGRMKKRASSVGAPSSLDALIAFALAPSKDKRIPSAAALVEELEKLLEDPTAQMSRRPLVLAVGVGAVLIAAGISAAVLLHGRKGGAVATADAAPPPPPPPAPTVSNASRRRLPRGVKEVSEGLYSFELPDKSKLELVYVPYAGPRLKAFYIGRTETTWKVYRAFCRAKHRDEPELPEWKPEEDEPVVNVSWRDANEFCAWAKLRLPNREEWARAASGDTDRAFPWGNDTPDPGTFCFETNPVYGGKRPARVKSFPRDCSPYGAFDMAGNVREWCSDEIDDPSTTDITVKNGAVKGGSYRFQNMEQDPTRPIMSGPDAARISSNDAGSIDAHLNFVGFRAALDDVP